jgi:hypothetical protein
VPSCDKQCKTKSKDSLLAEEQLPQRIERNDTSFSHEANRQPNWLLLSPEAKL